MKQVSITYLDTGTGKHIKVVTDEQMNSQEVLSAFIDMLKALSGEIQEYNTLTAKEPS